MPILIVCCAFAGVKTNEAARAAAAMAAKRMLASDIALGLAPARASAAARRIAQARLRVLSGRRDSVASAMPVTIDGGRRAAKAIAGAAIGMRE